MFAVPALLIYASGAVLTGFWRTRRTSDRLVALACILICAALLNNIARAAIVEHRQADACGAR
jgi:hypothetical protein